MSETPTTPVEEQDAENGAVHEQTAGTTGSVDEGTTENPASDAPAPAYGLGSGPVEGQGPDVEAEKYELNGEDFSDLPLETRAELHRNAGRTLSTDSAGIDRVVSNHVVDWEPAPIEPDPAVVAHTERVQAALEAAREERFNRLGLQKAAAEEQADRVATAQEG